MICASARQALLALDQCSGGSCSLTGLRIDLVKDAGMPLCADGPPLPSGEARARVAPHNKFEPEQLRIHAGSTNES